MKNITAINLSKIDIKHFASYYGKSTLYSFLIGSAVLAIVKNYKKAMMNEEVFSLYKYLRETQGVPDSENYTL